LPGGTAASGRFFEIFERSEINEQPWPNVLQAAATSSSSAPHATILSASSANGRRSAFAASQGARSQTFPFFIGRQDHRHRLRVDRLNHGIQRRRQKAIDEMRTRDRF
jgi:hypothetical protein